VLNARNSKAQLTGSRVNEAPHFPVSLNLNQTTHRPHQTTASGRLALQHHPQLLRPQQRARKSKKHALLYRESLPKEEMRAPSPSVAAEILCDLGITFLIAALSFLPSVMNKLVQLLIAIFGFSIGYAGCSFK